MCKHRFLLLLFTFLIAGCAHGNISIIGHIKTKEEQASITPQYALEKLKAGNERFVGNSMRQRDFLNK